MLRRSHLQSIAIFASASLLSDYVFALDQLPTGFDRAGDLLAGNVTRLELVSDRTATTIPRSTADEAVIDPFWDTADTAGLQAGNGNWSTSAANWNPNSDGSGARAVWTQNGDAVFQTNGASAVTVSGSVQVNSITFNGTGYTVDGTALTLTGSQTITANVDAVINAPFTGNADVIKAGNGTVTLTGNSTYTGVTTVNAGTLKLDNNNSTTQILQNTSRVTVNSGGTLLLAQSGVTASNNRFGDGTDFTLNGGTFDTGGLSEHGANNPDHGVGELTLQSTSIINMGTGASVLTFTKSNTQSWSGTLNVYNWSGIPITGGGIDQLYVGNNSGGLSTSQLAEIQFFSGNGTGSFGLGAIILNSGEVVPFAAVPEPTTWIGGGLTLGWFVFAQSRFGRRKAYASSGDAGPGV